MATKYLNVSFGADGRAGEDLIVFTECNFVLDRRANTDFGAGTNFYVGADVGKWVNNHIVGQVGGVFDDGSGMDFGHALDLRLRAGGHAFF